VPAAVAPPGDEPAAAPPLPPVSLLSVFESTSLQPKPLAAAETKSIESFRNARRFMSFI
jgi:hypothetical protein